MKIYFDYMSNSPKHGAHHKNILSNFPRPFHSHLVVISTHFLSPFPADSESSLSLCYVMLICTHSQVHFHLTTLSSPVTDSSELTLTFNHRSRFSRIHKVKE